MIRHANARVERQDPKWKEFYLPATKLRLSSYITGSLNSETCRMKLSFMNCALARITSTTAQTPQSIHMPSLPCTLERGTCTLVSFSSIFTKVCFRSLSITYAYAQQKLGSPSGAPRKILPTRCHRLRKVIETSPKTSSLRRTACANCVEDVFTSSDVAAQTTTFG